MLSEVRMVRTKIKGTGKGPSGPAAGGKKRQASTAADQISRQLGKSKRADQDEGLKGSAGDHQQAQKKKKARVANGTAGNVKASEAPADGVEPHKPKAVINRPTKSTAEPALAPEGDKQPPRKKSLSSKKASGSSKGKAPVFEAGEAGPSNPNHEGEAGPSSRPKRAQSSKKVLLPSASPAPNGSSAGKVKASPSTSPRSIANGAGPSLQRTKQGAKRIKTGTR